MPYPLFHSDTFTASASEASGGKTIDLGFVPDFVKVYNKTANEIFELHRDMGSGLSVKYVRIADDGSTSNYNFTFQGSGGIELVDTTTINTSNPVQKTKVQGFKIPAGEVTENDVFFWIAQRNA